MVARDCGEGNGSMTFNGRVSVWKGDRVLEMKVVMVDNSVTVLNATKLYT